jgi:cysteine synthase
MESELRIKQLLKLSGKTGIGSTMVARVKECQVLVMSEGVSIEK